jgi:hypothetical protein
MRVRATLTTSMALAAGALLGWLTASGRLNDAFGQTAKPQPGRVAGTQLPQPDPVFKGKVLETYKDSTPSYPLPGKLAYHYNFADFEFYDVDATDALPPGKVTIKLEYASRGTPKGSTISDGAHVKLFVNDKPVAEGDVKRAMFRHGVEPFEVGRDSISPVNAAYKGKGDFAFTGTIDKIQFEVAPMKVGAANRKQLAGIDAALRDGR